MQAAVINILINLQSKQLGNYGDVKICFPLPLHSTGTDRAFKFLNMPFMFSRALKSLWTVSLLGDAPSSPIPTGRLAILFIQWQEVFGLLSAAPAWLKEFLLSYPARIRAFLHPSTSFCLLPVTQSEHLLFIFSLFVSRIFFFPLLGHRARFFKQISQVKVQDSDKNRSTNNPLEIQNKTLPPCALCKRDILSRIQGGVRKLVFALCCNLDSRVQKQRSQC